MTATEKMALEAMRNAVSAGMTDETAMVEAAATALHISGMDADTAKAVAQITFNKHYGITKPL